MGLSLNEDWTAEVVGCMHKYRISNSKLAEACGYAPTYLSSVLNGHRAQGVKTRETILAALQGLVNQATECEEGVSYDNS